MRTPRTDAVTSANGNGAHEIHQAQRERLCRGRRWQDVQMALISLQSKGEEQLERARQASNGRASETVHHGSRLRQTLLALTAGTRLGEHQSPGDATVLCLRGHVVLNVGDRGVDIPQGGLVDVPKQRHDLVAKEDSVVVLTVGVG